MLAAISPICMYDHIHLGVGVVRRVIRPLPSHQLPWHEVERGCSILVTERSIDDAIVHQLRDMGCLLVCTCRELHVHVGMCDHIKFSLQLKNHNHHVESADVARARGFPFTHTRNGLIDATVSTARGRSQTAARTAATIVRVWQSLWINPLAIICKGLATLLNTAVSKTVKLRKD